MAQSLKTFKENLVLFPAPAWQLTSICNFIPGGLMPSAGQKGQMYPCCVLTRMQAKYSSVYK